MSVKMKMKMKIGFHRSGRNRPMSRHGYKYSKYKNCLGVMVLICVKQIMRKLSNTQAELKKSVTYRKSL